MSAYDDAKRHLAYEPPTIMSGAEWRRLVEGLVREIEALEAFKRSVDEALNTGDGAYRP